MNFKKAEEWINEVEKVAKRNNDMNTNIRLKDVLRMFKTYTEAIALDVEKVGTDPKPEEKKTHENIIARIKRRIQGYRDTTFNNESQMEINLDLHAEDIISLISEQQRIERKEIVGLIEIILNNPDHGMGTNKNFLAYSESNIVEIKSMLRKISSE